MITADLKGKCALITGAASGIGLATAELFARCGATVAINDLANNPQLEAQVARLKAAGLKALAAPGNIGDAEDAGRMVRHAAEAMGRLDYLVNNAGTPGTRRPIPPSDLDRQDEAFWNKLLNVNLIGPFRCTRAALPWLKSAGGAVVMTASMSGVAGGGSSSAYCATKAGLINMTKELARGLGPEVRVNAIAPSVVIGSNWDCVFDDDQLGIERIPLKRGGRIEDYAEAILFLCAGAAYMTGATLTIDGGLSA